MSSHAGLNRRFECSAQDADPWEDFANKALEQCSPLDRVVRTTDLPLPMIHAAELIGRPELHQFLLDRRIQSQAVVAQGIRTEYERRELLRSTGYHTYVECFDYSRFKDLPHRELVNALLDAVQSDMRKFYLRAEQEAERLCHRIERLYARTAPIVLQAFGHGVHYPFIRVNDHVINLALDARESFDVINVREHLRAESVPKTSSTSDRELRVGDIVAGSGLIDLRIVTRSNFGRPFNSGRPTWIDLNTWARTTPAHKRNIETRLAAALPPGITHMSPHFVQSTMEEGV
jgi:hypothetical protein